MTKRWITTKENRRTRKYKALHAQLREEVYGTPAPVEDKRDRKQSRSASFRRQGDVG